MALPILGSPGVGAAESAPSQPASEISDTAAGFLELAEEARARGDPEGARARYERLLDLGPGAAAAARAEAGLGELALEQGDADSARAHFERALEHAPRSVPALLGRARLAMAEDEAEHARELLRQAAEVTPADAELHALRAELEPDAYDPPALLRAGREAAGQGDEEKAVRLLRQAVLLADRHPPSARAALAALARLEPDAWAQRRVVPVYVWADETLRAREGWRFQVRVAFFRASRRLDELLATHFLPVSLGSFEAGDAGDTLAALDAAFLSGRPAVPSHGILVRFTARPVPRRQGARLGQATFLGRNLSARFDDPERGERTLAHELLHLYGAIHVADDVESLMNASGDSWQLDPPNARIVRALRERRFGPGGLEGSVFSSIDLEETTEAYTFALRNNLVLRRLGLQEGRLREAVSLDSHLGDVCRFLAQLLWRGERRVDAALMWEAAGRLYGPETRRGRAALQQARELRAHLRQRYDVD